MAEKKTVFVSYSSKDRRFVKQIVDTLEASGIRCWKAPEMIPAGSSYAKEIPKAIRECQVFLLILSSNSQESVWVEKETDSAISNRKTIIPFQIDDAVLNDTFTFYLNNVQMVSYVTDPKQAMEDLLLELEPYANKKVCSKGTANETVKIDGDTTAVNSEITRRKEAKKQNVRMSFARSAGSGNTLRMNRIPVECRSCGSKALENTAFGTYRCTECGTDNYDDFMTVRRYLEEVGHAPAIVIERETGVPRRVIEYFFKEEYLEIPSGSPVRIPCAGCGSPIRTGTLCENCKQKRSSSGTKTFGYSRGKSIGDKDSRWRSGL